MIVEKEKLINMLKNKKISESEFQLLAEALSKKSICDRVEESVWINPFKRIAGIKALLLGLMIMVAMSLAGTYANLYFDSPFSAMLNIDIKTAVKPGILLLIYQNIVNCAVLSLLYYTSAIIYGKRGLRIIDFLGTVTLSRYPYLLLSSSMAFITLVYPSVFQIDYSQGYDLRPSIAGIVIDFMYALCYVWQILTYMFAFKESSGLEGKKFWISYIATTFVIGPLIATLIARIPLYIPAN